MIRFEIFILRVKIAYCKIMLAFWTMIGRGCRKALEFADRLEAKNSV